MRANYKWNIAGGNLSNQIARLTPASHLPPPNRCRSGLLQTASGWRSSAVAELDSASVEEILLPDRPSRPWAEYMVEELSLL